MKKGGVQSEECVVLRTDSKCRRLCALPTSTDLVNHPDSATPFTNTNTDKSIPENETKMESISLCTDRNAGQNEHR